MRSQNLSFSQVLDIYGFRIVVETLPQCYMALGVLHALYKPIPGKVQDYIAMPKLNSYQSLHTTLIGPYGAPVEFQIRTLKCITLRKRAWPLTGCTSPKTKH